MCHENVEIIDSIYAIILVDAGMETESPVLNLNLKINDVFPEKPLNNYRELLRMILDKLSLPDILEAELNRFSKCKEKLQSSRFFQKPSNGNEEIVHVNKQRNEQSINEDNITNNFIKHDRNIEEKAGPSSSAYTYRDQNIDNGKQQMNNKKNNSGVEQNTAYVKRLKVKTTSSDVENDEGYDTISFNVLSQDISPSPINNSSNNANESNILQINVLSQKSAGVPRKKESLNSGQSSKKENSPTMMRTKQKLSLKNKFKVFKFNNPNPDRTSTKATSGFAKTTDDSIGTSAKSKNSNTNFATKSKSHSIKHNQKSMYNQKSVKPTSDITIPSCSKQTPISTTNSIGNSKSFDSVQNDLELLKLMPGFNDDFEVDFDFDWDNFKDTDCPSSTMKSGHKDSVNNTLKSNKLNTKQPSSNNSIGSSVARFGPYSQTSVSLFEADDDELDLDF